MRKSTKSGWNVCEFLSVRRSWRKKLKRMELIGTKMKYSTKTWLSKVTKLLLLHPYRTGIYGYGYIHGYSSKICGYGYGYGWECHPRQPYRQTDAALCWCTIGCLVSPCLIFVEVHVAADTRAGVVRTSQEETRTVEWSTISVRSWCETYLDVRYIGRLRERQCWHLTPHLPTVITNIDEREVKLSLG